MSWKLIRTPKTVRVTKPIAKKFAEMDAAPRDRPLSERRLMVYQRLLEKGQFRPVTWATACCVETNCTYRVNGKHTSTMLAGLEELPEFYAVLEEYTCDTLEDVAQLYATFDSKMQSRSANDIYLSFAGTVPELAEVSSRILVVAATGMGYFKYGGDLYHQTSPAERAELLLEQPDFVLWLQEMMSGGVTDSTIRGRGHYKSAHLARQPVAAAMVACYNKSRSAATEFWTAVRDETGPNPTCPDRKLARMLLTTCMHSNREHGAQKQSGTREVYVKCLHAWNAWRKGESTSLNYYSDKPIPAVR